MDIRGEGEGETQVKLRFLPEHVGTRLRCLFRWGMFHHQINLRLGKGIQDVSRPPLLWFSTRGASAPRPREHLAISGHIFSCHHWRVLLASNGQRPGPLDILQCTGQPVGPQSLEYQGTCSAEVQSLKRSNTLDLSSYQKL